MFEKKVQKFKESNNQKEEKETQNIQQIQNENSSNNETQSQQIQQQQQSSQQQHSLQQQLKLTHSQLIKGLIYIENFITDLEEKYLCHQINQNEWSNKLQRRTQHYGYEYDYNIKSIDEFKYLGKLPEFVDFIIQRLLQNPELKQIVKTDPDQLIINEYEPGQGISKHTDKTNIFGDYIISLSISSPTVMTFYNGQQLGEVLLARKSLVLMTGDSRYKWQHEIKKRKSDLFKGNKIIRGKRISLTFRKVIKKNVQQ